MSRQVRASAVSSVRDQGPATWPPEIKSRLDKVCRHASGARAAFGVTVAAGVLAALIALAGARTFSRAGR